MKKNEIKITRIPGEATRCRVTLKLEFDPTDRAASERFARILRELIPEGDRAQFVADFKAAGAKAGFEAP